MNEMKRKGGYTKQVKSRKKKNVKGFFKRKEGGLKDDKREINFKKAIKRNGMGNMPLRGKKRQK